MKNVITFESSLKKEMLGIFGFTTDEYGYIVEKDTPDQKAMTPDGQSIHIDEWAGLMAAPGGGLIFIRSDLVSLIEFSDRIREI